MRTLACAAGAAAIVLALVLRSAPAIAGPTPPAVGARAISTPAASGIRPGNPDARTPPPGAWSTVPFDLTRYFAPAKIARWKAFHHRHRVITLTEIPVSLLFFLLFIGRAGRWLDRVSKRIAARLAALPPFGIAPARRIGLALRRLFGDDWAGALVFAYGFSLAGTLVDLPFSIASELVDQAAGLSNYTAGRWIWDAVKGEMVGAVILAFVVVGLFGLIRRLPRGWWLALGLPTFFLLFAYGLVSPYQTRLYYDFHPLKNRALVSDIRRMMRHEHLSLKAVKVIDASRTTNAEDAYFTGVGPSRELVLFDTLVKRLTPAEVVEVVGHELGHLRHRHIFVNDALSGAGLFFLMGLLAFVLRRAVGPMKLTGPGDIRALPLLFFTTFLLFNLVQPFRNVYSRGQERQADEVALTLTGNPAAFISMQVKVAEANHADVRPPEWVHLWFATHPSTYERIGMGLWYRRWLTAHLGRRASARPAGGPGG